MSVTKGLIVRGEWVPDILSGVKPWEMRSFSTSIRGKVAILQAGTKLAMGSVEIWHSWKMPLHESLREKYRCFHCVDDLSLLEKWRYPWILRNPVVYETPIPYEHKPGAVIFQNLPDDFDKNLTMFKEQ